MQRILRIGYIITVYIGRKLGAIVDRTLKCHLELAGEGIKYSRRHAKSLYCMLKLKYKRGKANFLKSVSHCISHDIITTDMFRKYSTKARQYIKYYHFLNASKFNTVVVINRRWCYNY